MINQGSSSKENRKGINIDLTAIKAGLYYHNSSQLLLRNKYWGGGKLLLEVGTSIIAGGVLGYSYLQQTSEPINDGKKIQRIAENAGLSVRDEKRVKSLRIYRKQKIEGGMEYVYQLPLGLSVKQIEANKHLIEDGLNVRKSSIDWVAFKKLKLNRYILSQIKRIIRPHQQKARKEIVIGFDGMLRVKVYDEPLTSNLLWNDDMNARKWRVPVGQTRERFIHHDFDERPHMIVAGATGYGKSQYLKVLITSLIESNPRDVSFTLIDLKDGASFKRFEGTEQVQRVANDPEKAKETLSDVEEAMTRKSKDIVGKGFEDAVEANESKRHFVIIDEAADLDKQSLEHVKNIARRGRGAGYRLIYATQYPTNETLPSQVRQNIGARVCFVLETSAASLATIDETGAEDLPDIPGRAIYKRVKKEIVQTPKMSNGTIEEKIGAHINIRSRSEDHGTETVASIPAKSGKHPLIVEKA